MITDCTFDQYAAFYAIGREEQLKYDQVFTTSLLWLHRFGPQIQNKQLEVQEKKKTVGGLKGPNQSGGEIFNCDNICLSH